MDYENGQDLTGSNDNVGAEGQSTDGQQSFQQDSGASQQPLNGQAQQPVWNGKEYALKYRGGEIVPETRDKLMNWAQLGYSYEQRAAAMKQREEELKAQAQKYEQLERLNQAFETNPVLKQQITDLYYKYQGQGQPAQGQGQPAQQQQQGGEGLGIIQPYLQRLDTLQQRFETYENRQADEMLNKEMSELQTKYGTVDWKTPDMNGMTLIDEVKREAYRMGGVPLEAAFRNLYWDDMQKQAKAEALKKQAEEQMQRKKKGVITTGDGIRAPVPSSAVQKAGRGRSLYDDVARETIQELQK